MGQNIIKVNKGEDMASGVLSALPSLAGTAIGSYFGGPIGGAIGSALGGQFGTSLSGQKQQQSASSPVDRRMDALKNDSSNVLKQGKAALSSMDEETRSALEPVLDEAIKKSTLEKQKKVGGI